MKPWEKRLNDLWLLLERCHATYMEPELFRLNTNQFLQTSRTITFIAQKNKSSIPEFETWYQSIVAGWASDPVMNWAKDSRNKIEKEGDLELHSTLDMTLFWSYLVEQDTKIVAGRTELLQAGTTRLIRIARKHLPTNIARSSAVKIERKWVANSLPQRELLQALSYIYTTLYRFCQEISTRAGGQLDGVIPGPTALIPASEAAREVCYLKLSDLALHYVHTKRSRIEEVGVPEEMRAAVASLREAMSTADGMETTLAALAAMAEVNFARDGFHVPVLLLFDKNMKAVDMLSMQYGDRTDKYIFWRCAADRVIATKAAAVATIGEAWIRDMKGISLTEGIDHMPVTGERLYVTGLDNTGQYRSAGWDIVRVSGQSKPKLMRVPAENDFSTEEVPNYYAPILRALGLPYPQNIASVLGQT